MHMAWQRLRSIASKATSATTPFQDWTANEFPNGLIGFDPPPPPSPEFVLTSCQTYRISVLCLFPRRYSSPRQHPPRGYPCGGSFTAVEWCRSRETA